MKKIILVLSFIFAALSCSAAESGGISFNSGSFFAGGGIGTAYTLYYSESVHTMTGIIDQGGYSRIPLYGTLFAGFKIYKNLAASLNLSDVFDYFKFQDTFLMLNTLQIYPTLDYFFPVKGLSAQVGWGGAILFPSPKTESYKGGIEWGSVVAGSVKYTFYQLGTHLHPEVGVSITHSELLKSRSTSFILFVGLAWE